MSSQKTVPVKIKFTGEKQPHIQLKIKHQIKDEPVKHTAIRTIVFNWTTFNGKKPIDDLFQSAVTKSTKHTDLVTNKTTFDKWTKAQWDKIILPAIEGYYYTNSKTDQPISEINASIIDDKTDNKKISLTVKGVAINQPITFTDSTNKTIKSETIKGAFGDPEIAYAIKVPEHYKLVKDDQQKNLLISFNTLPKNIKPIDIKITPIIDESTDQHTITRTITFIYPDGNTKDTTQSINLTRPEYFNQVTEKTTYGEFTPQTFAKINVPSLPGYHADTTPEELTVSKPQADIKLDIKYLPNEHQQEFVLIDSMANDSILKTVTINGKTDETVDISKKLELPYGYKYAYPDTVSNKWTFDSWDNKEPIKYVVKHEQKITSEKRTIKRFITIIKPDGSKSTTTQVAQFERIKTYDYALDKTIVGKWSPDVTLGEVYLQTILGYNPSETVPEITIKPTDSDQHITIKYIPATLSQLIYYINNEGRTISTQTVTGENGKEISFTPELPKNWILSDVESTPKAIKIDPNSTGLLINIQHQLKELPPKDITITRTINVWKPHEDGPQVIKQAIHGTVNRIQDMVTNDVSITDVKFKEAGFDTYNAPVIDGYIPDITVVNGITANKDLKDSTIDIHYHLSNADAVSNTALDNSNLLDAPTTESMPDLSNKQPNPEAASILSDMLTGKISTDEGLEAMRKLDQK